MEELYLEGLAIHGGPESCGGVREDAAEALAGVCAGRAIEPRKEGGRGADAVPTCGRQHRWGVFASRQRTSRGHCTTLEYVPGHSLSNFVDSQAHMSPTQPPSSASPSGSSSAGGRLIATVRLRSGPRQSPPPPRPGAPSALACALESRECRVASRLDSCRWVRSDSTTGPASMMAHCRLRLPAALTPGGARGTACLKAIAPRTRADCGVRLWTIRSACEMAPRAYSFRHGRDAGHILPGRA
jgi:hypothetical protein